MDAKMSLTSTTDGSSLHAAPDQAPHHLGCQKVAFTLAKFNIRLARLYHDAGNEQAYEKHLTNAMTSYEAVGWKLKGIDELKMAMPLIESKNITAALKTYGKSVESCWVKK